MAKQAAFADQIAGAISLPGNIGAVGDFGKQKFGAIQMIGQRDGKNARTGQLRESRCNGWLGLTGSASGEESDRENQDGSGGEPGVTRAGQGERTRRNRRTQAVEEGRIGLRQIP